MAIEAITEIKLDLNQPGIVTVNAKQYDTVRKVKARLYNGGVRWNAPTKNSVAVVGFKKSDRIGGFYDTTELGESAISIDGTDNSTITIALDRQVVTTPGLTSVEITFYDTITLSRLSTFSFYLKVEKASITELDLSSNPYFNVLAEDIRAVIEAKDTLTGLTAEAHSITSGSSPTIDVSGGSGADDPYHFNFGIPKGEKGGKGDTATPSSTAYSYAVSDSYTSPPASGSSSWKTTPAPVKGKYLWCRTTTTWSNNTTTISYSVAYIGSDGSGAVNSVNNKAGDVVLGAADINTTSDGTVQDALDNDDILIRISSITALPKTITNSAITEKHVVSYAVIGNPYAQNGHWTVTTSAGKAVISGDFKTGAETSMDLLLTITPIITVS